MTYIDMVVIIIADVLGSMFSAIIVGGLAWVYREKIMGVIRKPKLYFELQDNPNYRGESSQNTEPEYDILCRNNDKYDIIIISISPKDKRKAICDCSKVPTNVNSLITPSGTYRHQIDYTKLVKIEEYYRKRKITKCTIVVDTSEGKYSYKLDLTIFDSEARNISKAIRGHANKK